MTDSSRDAAETSGQLAKPQPAFADPAGTWNHRYSADGFLFGHEPNAWLAEHAKLWQPGQRVLCVADGEGRNSVHLASLGLQVDAFDISQVAVAKARTFANDRGVTVNFTVADCDSYPWQPGSCDGIAAIFVQFADPPLRKRLFSHMRQALKPGGTLVLQGYTPKQLDYRTGGPPCASHLYIEPLLREALAGMDIVELREYEADLAEGSGHFGRSALIGVVARK